MKAVMTKRFYAMDGWDAPKEWKRYDNAVCGCGEYHTGYKSLDNGGINKMIVLCDSCYAAAMPCERYN